MPFAKPYSPGQDSKLHLPSLSEDSSGAAKPYSPGQDSKLHLPDTSEGSHDGEGAAHPYSPGAETEVTWPGLTLQGGDERDVLEGSAGRDHMWGEGGNDVLIGNQGNDSLYGGAGNDLLEGDFGADRLTGGEGQDTFFYPDAANASPATTTGADQILDFQYGTDKIGLGVAGTADNYHSAGTTAASMDAAVQEANQNYADDHLTYVYLANEKSDTGYLLGDLDGNGVFEFGVTLVGNGQPGEFGYDAIYDASF